MWLIVLPHAVCRSWVGSRSFAPHVRFCGQPITSDVDNVIEFQIEGHLCCY